MLRSLVGSEMCIRDSYCTCKEKACDWEEAIPTVEITLPKLTNKSLGLSPYGRKMFVLSNDHVQEKLLKLAGKGVRDKLKNSLFNPKYMIGDLVYAQMLPFGRAFIYRGTKGHIKL